MFTLQSCGYKATYSSGLEISRPHGAPYYVFVYYRTPCLYRLQDGDMLCQFHYVLLEPSVPHQYMSLRRPHMDDWVHFEASEEGRQLLVDLKIQRNRPVLFAAYEGIAGIVKALRSLDRYPEKHRNALSASLLAALVSGLSLAAGREGEERATHRHFPVLSNIKTHLYQAPEETHRIEDLAAMAGLSPSRFQHLYKELLGQTPGEDIALARLERAKYLLENTGQPISSIAQSSGYTNETHMIRHFNKYVGTSPARYRRQRKP